MSVFFLRNRIVPGLRQSGCVDEIIFIQDNAPPQIVNPVKQLVKGYFRNARVVSCRFPTSLPPLSPDPNPCDFWLLSCLKDVVFSALIAH
ncbi:uncharacterized protein TNCV_117581 [Trichonephila clavipes]|nr:uncharacterized protein TNCV_117581 [Trichonephila clavipes]